MKRREEVDKYRDMQDEDLQAEEARLKESLFRLNFKLALGEVDAIKKMRQEKKSLARLRTLIAVAIVSGRPVAELRRMTGLGHEVMFAGVHGLEIAASSDKAGAHNVGDDVRTGIFALYRSMWIGPAIATVLTIYLAFARAGSRNRGRGR